jgi:hypothetical protein
MKYEDSDEEYEQIEINHKTASKKRKNKLSKKRAINNDQLTNRT